MHEFLQARKSRRDAGFTLLELAIVLCVMGILSAILVPSIVDIVKRAEETAALRNCRTYYEQLSFYVLEEPDLAIDDYIYVSGDYAYIVEDGEFKRAEEYTAEDGKLSGSGVVAVELPEGFSQSVVKVYEKAASSGGDKTSVPEPDETAGSEIPDTEPDEEAVQKDPFKICDGVLIDRMMKEKDVVKGSLFVYGNFAYEYDGVKLSESSRSAQDGKLVNTTGYKVHFEAEGVTVYAPVQ